MPIYLGDVWTDTAGLTWDEIGIYFVLRMLAWQSGNGSVSGDMHELKTMLKRFGPDLHGLKFNRIVPKLLGRFFERREDGFFYQKEVENELRKAEEISEKRSRIARERWSHSNEIKELAGAIAMPTQSQHNTTQHNIRKRVAEQRRGGAWRVTASLRLILPSGRLGRKFDIGHKTTLKLTVESNVCWYFRSAWPTSELKPKLNGGSAPISHAIG
jgi:uncharacterized protein YdaU (DUF1376 family)